jgi:Zn finger protein HypA/HybF (possibly regulating hydrogenase expression)
MREILIAKSIMQIITKEAIKNENYHVSKVTLEIGQVSGINVDALKRALQSAIRGSGFENTKFYFQFVSATARCKKCQRDFDTGLFFTHCPYCKSEEYFLKAGKELTIKSIYMERNIQKEKYYV